jgi:transposase
MGHSKTRRPGLPQLKLMLASLDPLAMPIASCSVSGHRADDQLYIPVIKQAQESLEAEGLLYVGDTKLGNRTNFAYLDKTRNYYLCPLSQRQLSEEKLQEAIQLAQQNSEAIHPVYQGDKLIAQTYELPRDDCYDASQQYRWEQRQVLVKSVQLAERNKVNLEKRLKKTQCEVIERFLPKQGRRIFTEIKPAQAFVDKVLKRYKVKRFLQPHFELVHDSKRGKQVVKCHLKVNREELERAIERLGWRVYATNCPEKHLSAEKVVQVYRREYRIEQNFHQLLNKITKLMPLFLSKENRIESMIKLLIVALKFSTAIQYQVRKTLSNNDQYLTGLIPYNKGRKVYKPTTYRLLKAFENVQLHIVESKGRSPTYKVGALQEHQKTILKLLQLPLDVYLHPCQRT